VSLKTITLSYTFYPVAQERTAAEAKILAAGVTR
jgi:cytochrome c oxidase assembly protein Cox11